jgi:hypothetical protein
MTEHDGKNYALLSRRKETRQEAKFEHSIIAGSYSSRIQSRGRVSSLHRQPHPSQA